MLDRSVPSWCPEAVLYEPSLCFTVCTSRGWKHFGASGRFIAVPLTGYPSVGLGICLLCAASSLSVPSLGHSPYLPRGGDLFSCCNCRPLLLQEPDYGALYEGRHPGFYVEANPMPTFKVCSQLPAMAQPAGPQGLALLSKSCIVLHTHFYTMKGDTL